MKLNIKHLDDGQNNENAERNEYFALDSEKKEKIKARRANIWTGLFDLIISTSITLLVAIFLRVFVAEPFTVDGQSMQPTFHDKDYIFVDQITYRFRDPKRGEIIVFQAPNTDKFYIKRIIALPKESIEITNSKEIKIYNEKNPNGFTLKEDYIDVLTGTAKEKITLGDSEYFVMGDNRYPFESLDSREFGPIRKETIEGRALFRLFPDIRLFTNSSSA